LITVRDATIADAPQIARLLDQLGYPSTPREVTERLDYWSADPYGRVLLAIQSPDDVVGCLSLHAVPYLEKTGRWARIESLVVNEHVRRAGVGTVLVQSAEAVARQWGCLAVEVTSNRNRHDAHSFYQRLGYIDRCQDSGRFLKHLP
jgi:N-acetylglutamate synthase-like GNAT family acetyltransferase